MALIIVRRVLRQRKEAEKYDSLCHKSRAVKSTLILSEYFSVLLTSFVMPWLEFEIPKLKVGNVSS